LRFVSDSGERFRVFGFGAVSLRLEPDINVSMQFLSQSLPAGITEIAGTQNAVPVLMHKRSAALRSFSAGSQRRGGSVLQVGNAVSLYDIDLSTGRATLRSPVPGLRAVDTVTGLTRPPSQGCSTA
jgi:hypothetical protein